MCEVVKGLTGIYCFTTLKCGFQATKHNMQTDMTEKTFSF